MLLILKKNKELIFEFENTIFAEGLSRARILKYLSSLHNLSQWFDKPFPDVTKVDVYKLVGDLEKSDRSVWTKRDYKVAIKRFFRWLNDGSDPHHHSINLLINCFWVRKFRRHERKFVLSI